MNNTLIFPLLTADQIEVKVKQVGEKGAVALLYKTARTDMDMLDTLVGPMNWRVDYSEIKGNLYCTLYVRDETTGEWVGKQDCGIESRSDGDGNEKKGEASDAFKRAGFRWGIGRELYTAPFTFLFVPTTKSQNGKWQLANPFEKFAVKSIAYDESRRISGLEILDSNGKVVFSYGKSQTGEAAKEQTPEQQTAEKDPRKMRNGERLRKIFDLRERYKIDPETCDIAVSALRDQGIVTRKKTSDMSDIEFSAFMLELEKRLKMVA